MDRYKIAIGKKYQAYRFPVTQSITRTVRYIDYCVKKKAVFIADNIPIFILESALIKVSSTTHIPIVVKSEEKARILSTVHSHKNIYWIKTLPSHSNYLIYYDCPLTVNPSSKCYLKVLTRSS
jgi:hypothetical protein